MTTKTFGGPAVLLDRSDINTDEIIPAKYLTEISKKALAPHLLEDLKLEGGDFPRRNERLAGARVLVTRANFGCGSSREHAVWALEANGIEVVLAESFARIFRQNMFNCGILAIELPAADIEAIFRLAEPVQIGIDLGRGEVTASGANGTPISSRFSLNPFDFQLVEAGGWLAFAEQKY
ncbi:MAG: 3-isopropylmalate dehydratase [Desulfobulbaceae bacterium A2]|nr:MAG: 3-isopropylmalate dehydratase [Desulfobulbaceae bacterium A2]